MTARILSLPRTLAGRQLLRESILERRGCWDFPDGTSAEEIDWDQLVDTLARDLAELEAAERDGRYPRPSNGSGRR